MKQRRIQSAGWRDGVVIVMAAAIVSGAATVVLAQGAGAAPARKETTGAQLFASNCSRCHMERYARERTDAQWQTIVMHMRVHANLPGANAQKITEYLQASN